jgi:hypothetical protein
MKILRILAFIACLNILSAHAGGESDPIAQKLMAAGKHLVLCAGIFCIGDGLLEMMEGKSLLPSFGGRENSTINGGLKTAAGVALFLAGQPNQ